MNDNRRSSNSTTGADLRILIENGEYWLCNNGDLAMLAVTIGRLRARWPDARIAVLTDTPTLLKAYFPEAEGVTLTDGNPWAGPSLLDAATRLGPSLVGPVAIARLRLSAGLPGKIRTARRRAARLLRMLPSRRLTAAPTRSPVATPTPTMRPPPGSVAAVHQASLVLALGGGYLTDADPRQATRTLNLLAQACDEGVPAVLVGQGLGPLDNPGLRATAADVLPRAKLIALRERRRGPQILRRCGVHPDRIVVTGDDAIELAFNARSERTGPDLGVCLRIANYSPVSRPAQDVVGRVVRATATRHAAALVPLIIGEYLSEDRRSTLPLLRSAANVVPPQARYTSPSDIARRVARCRIVVTGAYHLAVFALSQGVPAVALTSSQYYDDKFLGLQDMFGGGLTLVRLDSSTLEHDLISAVEAAWEAACHVRAELQQQAQVQIDASRKALDRVVALVEAATERE